MTRLAGHPTSRRRFLKASGTLAAMIPLVNLAGCSDDSSSSAPASPSAERSAPPPSASSPDQTDTPAQPAQSTPAQTAPGPAAGAQNLVKLEESDPQAQALGYKHDAGAVDAATYPRYEEGQNCANCQLYLAEQGDQEGWGGCSLFPGKLVAAEGWCNAYVAAS